MKSPPAQQTQEGEGSSGKETPSRAENPENFSKVEKSRWATLKLCLFPVFVRFLSVYLARVPCESLIVSLYRLDVAVVFHLRASTPGRFCFLSIFSSQQV